MPLIYDQDSRLRALSPVLDEHAEWFGRVLRHIFYPEKQMAAEMLEIPDNFGHWVQSAEQDETIETESIAQMCRLHDDMRQAAISLIQASEASSGARPEIGGFDALATLYDEFIVHIRRLERDLAATDNGMDRLTGLRNRHVMARDIERELERRARRGRPFCLALARIDNYAELRSNLSRQDHDALVVSVSEIIKQCIRSFDDAYRLGDGEFLMCLKQTEMSGGSAGLNRLKKLLEEHAPFYSLNGQEIRLTMSSCVAEPQPGDGLDDLIGNMRNDLNRYGGDADTALEYFEVSPLQRFVSDNDGGAGEKPH